MPHRIKISIKGAVQGVGFRPFIYKLAKSLDLKGYVSNTNEGVVIEAEGSENFLQEFILRIKNEKPPISIIHKIKTEKLTPNNFREFEIRKSNLTGYPDTIMLPDIASCPECLEETFDQNNRRYLYPFTNCTNCGPRYSIIESLPYDRARTTMKTFQMCGECKREYDDPASRRFHAQPNACPECGPHMELWNENGNIIESQLNAILSSVNFIKEGKIIAVKGLGGFHLFADALNPDVIERLRISKRREEKPFALMYPDILSVLKDCVVSEKEEELLTSVKTPIVLLKKREGCSVAETVAPKNPYLGIMIPYTPLHHLIMRYLKTPVVATSGNLSEEPICIDENDAKSRLKGIADFFLVHNRPIYRHVDDSIARIVMNSIVLLRRSRGYAPMPVLTKNRHNKSVVSVGGHLKNTIAVSKGSGVFISQHIGDLESIESYNSFRNTISKFTEVYKINPEMVICDSHPDYISAKYAKENFKNVIPVQHHVSHIFSAIAENDISLPVLGIAWDGAGYGDDKTIWGGEFILIDKKGYTRKAHLKKFPLPGGTGSLKNIYKTAFGLLYEIFGEGIFDIFPGISDKKEYGILVNMVKKNINSPRSSSAGRLFDAVAYITGVRKTAGFEGQAAMELEFLTDGIISEESYDIELKSVNDILVLDWENMLRSIINDTKNNLHLNIISVKFHNSLVNAIVKTAEKINIQNVALTGGCFQNKYLLENSIRRLKGNGFNVYWNGEVPANDGGISLGQIAYYSYYGNNKI
ncbi:MAG: carbamoyltransferase HypF [Ignavibacteria bacterium]|nr:carbamoyltransferase HypF [Ignavibacteria bacterium]